MTDAQKDSMTIPADGEDTPSAEFAKDVAKGFSQTPKRLPSLYFYDERGSLLFEQICDLPEYYLTRAETDILQRFSQEILMHITPDTRLVELGSGSSRKTEILLESVLNRHGEAHYCPIDISAEILLNSARALKNTFPQLDITTVADRYEAGLDKVHLLDEKPCLIMWLGSSIGNFTRSEATEFLNGLRIRMRPADRLLVGIDLRKEASILEPAYDDSQRVTAAFNLNLLDRINRELQADIDVHTFEHKAIYAEEEGRIEMHLVSTCEQEITIAALGEKFSFAAQESILTEYSYKYSRGEITTLAENTSFRLLEQWFDIDEKFSLNLLEPIC
jgi:dimethylhistidine N-methyltransferase